MRLAMRLPPKKGENGASDPREGETAEVIDLASRSAFPAVTERKSTGDGLGLAAGVALVFGLGALTLWSMNAAQVEEPEPIGNPDVAPPQAAAPQPAPVRPVPQAPAPKRPDPAPAPVLARTPEAGVGQAANPYASPAMVYDASTAAGSATAAPPAGSASVAGGSAATPLAGSAGAFAAAVGGVGGGPAQATQMMNPSTTVTKGTLIPAILETAINTDVPGYVRAVVSQDVRSFDGTKVLIPRSSRLIGQYQSGVQQGQKRAYVIWNDLITPEGVTIKISSPAVGFDGTTGLEGKVNSHFFKRFGSAMLLSVVGGLGASLSGGSTVFLGAGQQALPDADISPTIRVKMGEPVRVFTARNLDFSTVAN